MINVMLRDTIEENNKVIGFQYAINADSYTEAYQKALEMYREDKAQLEEELLEEALSLLTEVV